MKRKHIFLSEQQLASLRKIADQTGISLSEIIRRAIDQFIASHTPPADEISTV
jgi:hypothetical protein